MVFYALVAVQVVLALGLILLILLQGGEGADIGAVFGGGSSQTVFGGRGPATFLAKATITVGTLFLVTSITLALWERDTTKSLILSLPSHAQPALPSSTQRPGNAAG